MGLCVRFEDMAFAKVEWICYVKVLQRMENHNEKEFDMGAGVIEEQKKSVMEQQQKCYLKETVFELAQLSNLAFKGLLPNFASTFNGN